MQKTGRTPRGWAIGHYLHMCEFITWPNLHQTRNLQYTWLQYEEKHVCSPCRRSSKDNWNHELDFNLDYNRAGRNQFLRTRPIWLKLFEDSLKFILKRNLRNFPVKVSVNSVSWSWMRVLPLHHWKSWSEYEMSLVCLYSRVICAGSNQRLFNAAVTTLAEMERLRLIDMLPSRSTTITFLLDVWLMTTSPTTITQVINQSYQPRLLTNHTQLTRSLRQTVPAQQGNKQ